MRLVIVSGRSGSGKSTALDVLEDHGFYCIDNLPAGLLPELAERALLHTELLEPQVAVSIDARNLPSQLQRFPELLTEARNRHIKCDVLYLDADHDTLLKRFSETRRRHPLTQARRQKRGFGSSRITGGWEASVLLILSRAARPRRC